MAFSALHALIFCVDSVDIASAFWLRKRAFHLYQQCSHCQYILAHNVLNIQGCLKRFARNGALPP